MSIISKARTVKHRLLGASNHARLDYAAVAAMRYGALPGSGVTIIGDSLAQDGPWSELLGYPVATRAILGQYTREMKEWLSLALRHSPHTVVVWLGTNDALADVSPADFERDYEALVCGIIECVPSAKVVLMEAPPLTRDGVRSAPEVNAAIQKVGERRGLPLIQFANELAHESSAYDGIHLTGESYALIARKLAVLLSGCPAKG